MSEVYKQLIDDYIELQEKELGFAFGRIMNFLFAELSDKEKHLYIIIRKKVSLERLTLMLGKDWVDGKPIRMRRLIAIARKESWSVS